MVQINHFESFPIIKISKIIVVIIVFIVVAVVIVLKWSGHFLPHIPFPPNDECKSPHYIQLFYRRKSIGDWQPLTSKGGTCFSRY